MGTRETSGVVKVGEVTLASSVCTEMRESWETSRRLHVPSQKSAARDLHNLSREDKQGKGTREGVAHYKQEQLGYTGLLYIMDSNQGESLQVRVSREASKGLVVVGVCYNRSIRERKMMTSLNSWKSLHHRLWSLQSSWKGNKEGSKSQRISGECWGHLLGVLRNK